MAPRGKCADRLLTEDSRPPFVKAMVSPIETALRGSKWHPGALLSSDDCGSSVERAATLIRYGEPWSSGGCAAGTASSACATCSAPPGPARADRRLRVRGQAGGPRRRRSTARLAPLEGEFPRHSARLPRRRRPMNGQPAGLPHRPGKVAHLPAGAGGTVRSGRPVNRVRAEW